MTTGRSPPADRFEAAKALQAEIAPCATTRAFLHEGKSLTIASVGNSAATHVRTLRPGSCPSPCNSFRHRSLRWTNERARRRRDKSMDYQQSQIAEIYDLANPWAQDAD